MSAQRAVWIDEGTSADYPRLKPYAFDRLLFSARRHTLADLNGARANGYEVGIYRVPEWDANLGPAEWAKALSADVTRLGGNGTQLSVQADIETHDTGWISAFLAQWRKNRALRDTSFTFEGHQGGMLAPIRQQILDSKVELVPQAYSGAMDEWDADGVVADLVAWGFPYERILPFHDAAVLRPYFRGYAFTAQRLA